MSPERWQKIEQLYHTALEREPGERSAFLDQACQGDAELRREVEALLAQGDAAGDSTVTMLTPGAQLGPYQIEAPIGAGGMGSVYRAIDTRLGRKVATKICAQQFSGRFEREARAISALNHPHICTLYDVGPNYLVMELVEGETLAARLQKGRLPNGTSIGVAPGWFQESGPLQRSGSLGLERTAPYLHGEGWQAGKQCFAVFRSTHISDTTIPPPPRETVV
jgi:serine/threonine protein kinase